MANCIFCKIIAGDIPAEIVYQDENVVAFCDIHPQAPHHILVIPRHHYETLLELPPAQAGQINEAVKTIAMERGFARSGFRLISSCGKDAGQEVMHVHYHLLAGRSFDWPPG